MAGDSLVERSLQKTINRLHREAETHRDHYVVALARIAALEAALRGILIAETVSVHVGYDERGNYAWADAVRLDDEAFYAARTALERPTHD